MELTIGMEFTQELVVEEKHLAKNMGSGIVSVFATPMMIALTEKTASEGIQNYLDEGNTSVGTLINMSHDAPTPVGMKVTATTKITAIEGRKIVFDVVCKDEKTIIGKGTHERFVVNLEKFNSKANSK